MTETDQGAIDALHAARTATLAPDMDATFVELTTAVRQKSAGLIAAGWCPDTYARLRGMAEHTVRSGGMIAAMYRGATEKGQLTRPIEVLVVEHLVLAGESAAAAGGRIEQTEPWLTLYAAAGDEMLGRTLQQSLYWWDDADFSSPLSTWSARLGAIAPLAYAAGLTLAEAYVRRDEGILDEVGLRTLALLRGFRLP